MFVTPWACKVAAVATIMKKAIRFEKPMPTRGVDVQPAQTRLPLPRSDPQRLVGRDALDFLDLLLGLPEEEIRTDRRSQDGDDHGQVVLVPMDRRDKRRAKRGQPVDLDTEGDADVGEQGQRQPLQHADIAGVRQEHLEQQRNDPESNGEQRLVAAADQSPRSLPSRSGPRRD